MPCNKKRWLLSQEATICVVPTAAAATTTTAGATGVPLGTTTDTLATTTETVMGAVTINPPAVAGVQRRSIIAAPHHHTAALRPTGTAVVLQLTAPPLPTVLPQRITAVLLLRTAVPLHTVVVVVVVSRHMAARRLRMAVDTEVLRHTASLLQDTRSRMVPQLMVVLVVALCQRHTEVHPRRTEALHQVQDPTMGTLLHHLRLTHPVTTTMRRPRTNEEGLKTVLEVGRPTATGTDHHGGGMLLKTSATVVAAAGGAVPDTAEAMDLVATAVAPTAAEVVVVAAAMRIVQAHALSPPHRRGTLIGLGVHALSLPLEALAMFDLRI